MARPKKSLGQNFLRERGYIKNIIEKSCINDKETVLEIGAGEGAITGDILENVKKIICVEIDEHLCEVLKDKFGNNSKFHLINKDVLKLDFDKEISKKVKVIANIPYYITSPIINKLIDNREYIDEIIIMTQKEVAERICGIKTRDSGVLTFVVAYFANAEILFEVPSEAFYPAPKVNSAVMRIIFNEEENKNIDYKTFLKYVKSLFANKRKNIVNNLIKFGFEKDQLKELLTNNGIDPKRRAETFDLKEMINLIKILENNCA